MRLDRVCLLSLLLLLLALNGRVYCQVDPDGSQAPEAVLQVGHRRAVRAIAFSPDGRWLASGAKDNTIKIWDVATGRLLRTLYGHGAPVNALAVSPDGKMLASGSGTVHDVRYANLYFKGGVAEGQHQDASVRLWDVGTGRQLRVLLGHELAVMALAYSRDGRTLTSVSSDTIKVWDLSSGNPVSSLAAYPPPKMTLASEFKPSAAGLLGAGGSQKQKQDEDPLQRVWRQSFTDSALDAVISGAGDIVAVALPGKKFRLFAPIQNRELRGLDVEAPLASLSPLAFSPDGQSVAFLGKGNEVVMQTISTGENIWRFSAHDLVTLLCFSPDGKSLLVETTRGGNRALHWLAGGNGSELGQIEIFDDRVSRVIAFSPDARLLAMVARGENDIELLEASTGELLRIFKTAVTAGTGSSQTPPAYSDPELRRQLSAMGIIRGGELKEAEEDVGDFSSAYRGGESILFTPDSKWLLWKKGGNSAVSAVLWDTVTGTQVPNAQAPQLRDIGNPDHSPDGRIRVVPQYEAQTQPNNIAAAYNPFAQLGRGRNELAQRVTLVDAHSGRKLQTLEAGSAAEVGLVPTTGFNPEGSRIAVRGFHVTLGANTRWVIYVFDTTSGNKISQVDIPTVNEETGLPFTPHWGSYHDYNVGYRGIAVPTALAISRDGTTIAVGFRSKISLFDSTNGKLLLNIPHAAGIAALSFNPDGRLLAVLGKDGDSYIFETRNGRLLATLISVSAAAENAGSNDWVVVTPDGKFDGSPAGWNQILWRFGGDTFNVSPVETFFNEFYYPGLLAEVLAGKKQRATRSLAQLDRRQPSVAINVPSATGSSVDSRSVAVQVRVAEVPADNERSQGSGVRDVRLFRNGSLVKLWKGDLHLDSAGRAALEAMVTIVAGQNRLTAYAFNHDNIKSADATMLVTGSPSLKRSGTAYVVSVGVNEYVNPDYNLKFAVADAQDMSAELKSQQSKLGKVRKVEVIQLMDAEATKQNVLLALQRLAGSNTGPLPSGSPTALAQLQPAQPEDEVFVYFAGHGVAVGPRFYLIPHDLGYMGKRTQLDEAALQAILTHSISDVELEDALEKVDARDAVLVIDACNSGQALEADEKRRGPMNSKGLAQVAYEKGMYVLTAAQGYQAALEAAELGHGLLTYALVEEGLKTAAADREPKDGIVVAKEWLDYAIVRVPELQASQMAEGHKQGREISFTGSEEEGLEGVKQSGLQRPRVFYRRELDPEPLVVAKP